MLLRLLLRRLAARLEARPGEEGVYELEIPELALRYAESIARATGLPLEEVLRSRPVQSYIRRLERRVRIRVQD